MLKSYCFLLLERSRILKIFYCEPVRIVFASLTAIAVWAGDKTGRSESHRRLFIECVLRVIPEVPCDLRGRDRSVGVATRYGLDDPGIESRWGRDFPYPSRPVSYTVGTGSLPGVKRPGHGVDYPPPSSAEVEGRVELYICSPSWSSWPVLG